jgi:hypothetical protein
MDDIENTPQDESNPAGGEMPDGGAVQESGSAAEAGDAAAAQSMEIGAGEEDIAAFSSLAGGSAGFGNGDLSAWPGPMLPGLEVLGFQPGLELTEKQRQHVGLLRKMLESEEEPAAKPRVRRDHMAGFWDICIRFGAAALLLVVIISTLIQKTPGLPPPSVPAETSQALDWIERLEVDDVVLVGFEYQPGFAAELENAASPVLNGVARRGARILTISTLPLGPLQAEQYWSAPRRRSPSSNAVQTDHLGYLPGGSLGLAKLGGLFYKHDQSGNPKQTRPYAPLTGFKKFPNLPEIDRLNMVIVITEDAQKARDWIEQLRPDRANIPLVIVTSAQAAPILRPYLSVTAPDENLHQVAGMVAGLGGVYGLDNPSPDDHASAASRNAYEMGALAGGVAILAALILGQLHLRRPESSGLSRRESHSQ